MKRLPSKLMAALAIVAAVYVAYRFVVELLRLLRVIK